MPKASIDALDSALRYDDDEDDDDDDDDDEAQDPPPALASARGAWPASSRPYHDQGALAAGAAPAAGGGELYTPRRSGRFDPQTTLSALGAGAAAQSPSLTPRTGWADGLTPRLGQRTPPPVGLGDRSAMDRSSWLPSPRQSMGILRALSAEGSVDCSTMSKQARPAAPALSLSLARSETVPLIPTAGGRGAALVQAGGRRQRSARKRPRERR